MKKTKIIAIIGVLLFVCMAGRFAWISMSTLRVELSVPSHNGEYVAKMKLRRVSGFWSGTPLEIHEVWIESKNGHTFGRMVTEEPSTEPSVVGSMYWAEDESGLCVALRRDEAMNTHLFIPVYMKHTGSKREPDDP